MQVCEINTLNLPQYYTEDKQANKQMDDEQIFIFL